MLSTSSCPALWMAPQLIVDSAHMSPPVAASSGPAPAGITLRPWRRSAYNTGGAQHQCGARPGRRRCLGGDHRYVPRAVTGRRFRAKVRVERPARCPTPTSGADLQAARPGSGFWICRPTAFKADLEGPANRVTASSPPAHTAAREAEQLRLAGQSTAVNPQPTAPSGDELPGQPTRSYSRLDEAESPRATYLGSHCRRSSPLARTLMDVDSNSAKGRR